MKKSVYLLMGAVLALSQTATANTVFSCFTQNGKHISLIQKGSEYEYSFGKPGKPELVFKNSVKEVIKRSPRWDGIGSSLWSEMHMKNGKYIYSLYMTVDRMADEHEAEYGVSVIRGEEHLTTVKCSPTREIIFNPPEELAL